MRRLQNLRNQVPEAVNSPISVTRSPQGGRARGDVLFTPFVLMLVGQLHLSD